MVYGNGLKGFGGQVEAEQAVAQGGNPQAAVLVRAQRSDVFALQGLNEHLIAAEKALLLIGNVIALVGGAEPQVAAAVAEDAAHFRGGDVEGEGGMVLMQERFAHTVIIEESLADGIEQDAVVIYSENKVYIALHQAFIGPNNSRELFPCVAAGVQDVELSHTGEPEFLLAESAQMVGLDGEGNGGLGRKVRDGITLEGEAVVGQDPEPLVQDKGRCHEAVEVPNHGLQTLCLPVIAE